MKKLFAIIILTITSFSMYAQDDKAAAKVWQEQGIYVFFYSKPVAPYESLGTFKVKQKFTGEPKEQIKTGLDELHKTYPKADAIIFTDGNMQQAEAIKFK